MTWADRAGTGFACEKTPVTASRGMAVTNHPLASAAAAEMMAAGGNAIDATVAALFTLTVVEPMMVGIFGGGTALIGLADGREMVIDGLSTAPALDKTGQLHAGLGHLAGLHGDRRPGESRRARRRSRSPAT